MTEKGRDSRKSEEREKDEIKVTDRRAFTMDGELRDEGEVMSDAEEAPEPSATADAIPTPAPPDASDHGGAGEQDERRNFEHRPVEEPEGVDFTMLINAMAQPALIFLGEIPHPGSGQAEINLEQARLQIDLLDLLRIKCRGNVTAEEEGLMDRILYQLRMLYVTRSDQPAS